jgi:hypothetical protein
VNRVPDAVTTRKVIESFNGRGRTSTGRRRWAAVDCSRAPASSSTVSMSAGRQPIMYSLFHWPSGTNCSRRSGAGPTRSR